MLCRWNSRLGGSIYSRVPRDPSVQMMPAMGNWMEKNMDNETETGVIEALYRDPKIHIIPTLGP